MPITTEVIDDRSAASAQDQSPAESTIVPEPFLRMTITGVEMEAIEKLAEQQNLSPAAVMRQALRAYQQAVRGPLLPGGGCMGE